MTGSEKDLEISAMKNELRLLEQEIGKRALLPVSEAHFIIPIFIIPV